MATVFFTLNMNLIPWDEGDDPYDYAQLSGNFVKIDLHDHTTGKGRRIPTGGLEDSAVTSIKIAPRNVTRNRIDFDAVGDEELADDAVTRPKLADDAVGPDELDEEAVEAKHLAPDVLPIGSIMPWWRPNNAHPVPDGWVPCDGRSLSAGEHDFAGGGTISVPDLTDDRKLIGTNDTGIGTRAGSNTVNLGHVHTSAAHTHVVSHFHTMPNHVHVIITDGIHDHGFLGLDGPGPFVTSPTALGSRGAATSVGSTFQALYLAGFNTGNNTTAFLEMEDAGGHSHGGTTVAGGSGNTSTEDPTSSATAVTTDSSLGSTDVRGAYLKVLFLIKVKNT